MISVKKGIRAEEVRQGSQHVLFVEGRDKNSLDPHVLGELFEDVIKIETLGASFSVRSAAEALFSYHPTYYFLIDRDHYEDDFIERCWENFPDPETHNLLIWRRREIENYFLDPEYLSKSEFCCVTQKELAQKILQCASQRLFLDVANYVVTSIREELKRNWIQKFSNPEEFQTKEMALDKLKNTKEFGQYRANVEQKVSCDEVERRFLKYLQRMTGGKEQLVFGRGDWLDMIQGKQVLAQIINSACFKVQTRDGAALAGREKLNEIVKKLLKNSSIKQPEDFVRLKQLINTRIYGASRTTR